jgi:mono/diheme cytochrome c family protein
MTQHSIMFRYTILLLALGPCSVMAEDANLALFEKAVRPLFAQQCISCHGPQKQKGGLRLDESSFISKGGESGKIIVPGSPEKSLLFNAVCYTDDSLKMPPRGKLPVEQIEQLRSWIAGGASLPATKPATTSVNAAAFSLSERQKHWCYQPLKKVTIPECTAGTSPIDAFIQQAWKQQGLKPATTVSKSTWLRRVTFDLTGLPPTPEELQAFELDTSKEAYAKVVDQLLARPQYGERWARHWLDLMRYADTLGHEFDFDLPNAWRYRNYVIRALNDDVPYDQFVREQLAGDLLKQPRMNAKDKWNESIQGTAFLWLGEGKQAPVDVRQEQADRIDNQIDVIGKAFLGQTIACARCHDHKFDAIATRDYYALYGVLKSSRYEQAIIDDVDKQKPVLNELITLHRAIEAWLKQQGTFDMRTKQDIPTVSLLDSVVTQGPAWQRAEKPTMAVFQDPKTKKLMQRYIPANSWDSGLLSETLEGSLRTKTFTIDQPSIHVLAAGHGGRIRLVIDGFAVIRDPIYGSLRRVVNNVEPHWLSFDVRSWKGREAYLEFLDGGPADLSMTLDHAPGKVAWLQIREIDLSWSTKAAAFPFTQQPIELGANTIDDPTWKSLQLRKQAAEAKLPSSRYSLATAEGSGSDEQVFIRGNHRLPGEKVTRGLSAVFCGTVPLPVEAGSGRLALADRLTNPEVNPLLVRVIVNRLWKHHFGEGLVRSVDDFGIMGETPSHPELLEYLCQQFIENGWSLKKLHRAMVLSETYRLSSQHDDAAKDPQRRWLTHLPLRRLEAEAWRDSMLSIAGKLRSEGTNEGVMPFITSTMQGRGKPSSSGPVDGNGYRSIYLSVRRNFLPAWATAFDFPTPFTAIGKRSLSNTPAQGLTLMNDPLVLNLAEAWAERILKKPISNPERLALMYQQAFCRTPASEELQTMQSFLEQHPDKNDKKAWTDIAHALFCSKEFILVP